MTTSNSRRAYLIWAVGLCVYVIAVAGRTSLGMAGLLTAERFNIGAATLAVFVSLQLGVYGGAQIPLGLLLDRVGSRKVLAGGALLLAVGQSLLAFAPTLGWALVARVLVGLGDATAFVSLLRLLPAWFAPRRVPMLNQITSATGQLGQVISAIPFFYLLRVSGWSLAFATLALSGAVMGLVAFAVVRDKPGTSGTTTAQQRKEVSERDSGRKVKPASFRKVLANPAARLGFWAHFSLMTPAAVFMLMWGVPFMEAGLHLSEAQASSVVLAATVAQVICSPLIGMIAGRYPHRARHLALGVCVLLPLSYLLALGWASAPGYLAVLAWSIIMSALSPTANIGFDLARRAVEPARLGIAMGLTNTGGFLACLLSVQVIGFVIDAAVGGSPYSYGNFRAAFACQLVIQALGLLGFICDWRAAHRREGRSRGE